MTSRPTAPIIHLLSGSIIIVIMVIISTTAHACPNQAQSFWNGFRNAVLKSDVTTLIKMTHFPLSTRGTLDSDPVKAIGVNEFKLLLPALLASDPGMSIEPSSMEKYVVGFVTLPVSYCDQGLKRFHVGSWEFSMIGKDWFFTMAYVEE